MVGRMTEALSTQAYHDICVMTGEAYKSSKTVETAMTTFDEEV